MFTNRQHVKILIRSILNRLEQGEAVAFAPRLRNVIVDEMERLFGVHILTEEDFRNRAIDAIGANREAFDETNSSETERFKSAKQILRAKLGQDEIKGLYYQKTVKALSDEIAKYFMRSSHIEDVFLEDDELSQQIVDIAKKFDVSQLH